MHALLVRVRDLRQLSSAQLFAISDYDVISDLVESFCKPTSSKGIFLKHNTLAKVKQIFNEDDYAGNSESQGIVELILARITAAIR
jgi:hypothetical protein